MLREAAMLVLLGLGAALPARAQPGPTDRVLDLVAEARRSPCFQAPTRPPLLQGPPAEVAVAAAEGDGMAMLRIAEAYLAEPARPRQALEWLERAALAGAVAAAAEAGRLHAAGRGTPADLVTAAAWWRFGATRGELRAMACLSAAHLLGRGVAQDLAEAARWALLREMRAPGRALLRPAAAEFERSLPATTLALARRLAASLPEPSLPPAAGAPPPAAPAGGTVVLNQPARPAR